MIKWENHLSARSAVLDANYKRYMQARNQLSARLPNGKTTSASLFSLDPFLFFSVFFPCDHAI
jgi:hypothetical protein